MEQLVIPMSFEEFEVMEHPFGWKVEYWDAHARLTPRSIGVTTKLNLCPRHAPHNYVLVPVSPDYRERMIAGYVEAFSHSVEFCGLPLESIEESAIRDMNKYFSGTRGAPLSASVMALAPGSQALAGLALLVRRPEQGAYMDLLYVLPDFQRQGVATAMLNWAIAHLLESGCQTLASRYHVCNEKSRLWHHRYGFEDEYDCYYAQMKVNWYRSEIWRRKKLGLMNGLADLKQECDRWVAFVPTDLDED
jgi:GNAT superfamily N-acetyltransferase